jgi:hypothetical protein
MRFLTTLLLILALGACAGAMRKPPGCDGSARRPINQPPAAMTTPAVHASCTERSA